jgi:hypothetical protein
VDAEEWKWRELIGEDKPTKIPIWSREDWCRSSGSMKIGHMHPASFEYFS